MELGNSQFFHDNLFKFLEKTFFPYIEENNISTVLILGDTWDKRKNIDFNILYDVRKRFFNRLLDLNIDVKIIYGNHDIYFKNTNIVNSIDLLLSDYSNIEIVKTHKEFDFDGLKLGMISWINPENLIESLQWIKNVSVDILCGHFEIESFEMVKGHSCEKGLKPYIFNNFQKVLSGHFHVISDNGIIHYIGNPNQTNWGDYGLKKGFTILDTATKELTLIENQYNVYEKIDFIDDKLDIVKFDYDFYRDKIVRIYTDLSNQTLKRKLDLFFDKLQEVTFSCEIINTTKNNEKIMATNIEVDKLKIDDTFTLISEYINVMETNNIDKTLLKEQFKNLYQTAIENNKHENQ